MTKALRILIADDHDLMRRGIKGMLQSHPGWEICGEAHTGREAVTKAQELKPDIAILDISMPDLNGVDAARRIRKESPNTEILILSVHYSDQLIRDILEAGVRGYIVKSDSDRDLIIAVETLANHKPFLTPRATEVMLTNFKEGRMRSELPTSLRDRLTSRGAGNRSIARGGKEQQGSGVVALHQRKNSGNTPRQYHAQAAAAHRERAGPLRRAKSNCRSLIEFGRSLGEQK